jgi:hypothetical protein
MPSELAARLDTLLSEDREIQAFKLLWDALEPRPSLPEAQELVAARKDALGLAIRKPSPTPDVDALCTRLMSLEPKPVALEALWDGDTHGWFVVLEALLPVPSRENARYTAHQILVLADEAGDFRLFKGAVPPWSEARLATSIGEELARRLGVPFYFASPDRPTISAPRWWDAYP